MTSPAETEQETHRETAPDGSGETWGWTRPHRITLALLLTCFLVFLILQYIRRPVRLDDAVTLQHGPMPELETTLDPNTADAPSLSRISSLGDKLAQAIVDYREFHQDEHGITFQNLEDLRHIRGIGPKTLEQLRPYLRFPGDATQPAAAPHGLTPPAPITTTEPADPQN